MAASVFDRYRVQTYKEAEHKPYVMAAMILLNRFARPDQALYKVLSRDLSRRMRVS